MTFWIYLRLLFKFDVLHAQGHVLLIIHWGSISAVLGTQHTIMHLGAKVSMTEQVNEGIKQ